MLAKSALRLIAAAPLILCVTACQSGPSFAPARSAVPSGARRVSISPIQHVVFIIQENRSFNNLFMGFPKATTQNYGYDTTGNKISLHSQDLATTWDIDHFSPAFFKACDGTKGLPGTHCKMDGWNNEIVGFGAPKNFAYAYTPQSEIAPYWSMAKEYVLADKMFASNLDGSFIAHQYAVAAYASHAVDGPLSAWGCEGGKTDTIGTLTKKRTTGPSIVTCFDNPTIGTNADTAGVSWRFYTGGIYSDGGLWSSYQAISSVYDKTDWSTDVVNPPAQFLTDIGNGQLANVTWITPNYATSDHPGLNASGGPAWVASLVDAIGTSPFWDSTAIFIMWDDWGGWFDPVKPVFKDYDGLGFRVPLIVISPYARQGSVTHTQYETSSVLRYIEDNFNLPQMAKSDARAKDPAADPTVFNYGQSPRAFKKIHGARPAAYWFQLERNSTQRGKPGAIIGDD
jgi:phospholipase C